MFRVIKGVSVDHTDLMNINDKSSATCNFPGFLFNLEIWFSIFSVTSTVCWPLGKQCGTNYVIYCENCHLLPSYFTD